MMDTLHNPRDGSRWHAAEEAPGRSGATSGQSGKDDPPGALATLPPQGEPLPPAIGTNERRMQVRAYNFWASQLKDRPYPPIAELDTAAMADFGDHAVLLDFTADPQDPRIAYLGAALAEKCAIGARSLERLSDVPARSLLSRITDHYLQIIANQAPIGFEAEFVDPWGVTFLYRGILLPYSSDGSTIDFLCGVINWKELAEPGATEELLLEIEHALVPHPIGPPLGEPLPISGRPAPFQPLANWADGPGLLAAREEEAEFCELQPALPPQPDEAGPVGLADWLERARAQAAMASQSEDRTRTALYEAIGRAWDFARAAAQAPRECAALIAEAGLSMQQRAPLTPIVKLVFGAGYDKTRLTEYAAALAHAQRLDLPSGTLAAYLRDSEGGLKGVVAAERRLRREEAGKPARAPRTQVRPALARRLRAMPAGDFSRLGGRQEEFALVMIRRGETGTVQLLGQIPADVALVEKAARQLLA